MVGARVELRGQHVRWKTAPAALHVTTNPGIPEEPILVVAPHPDDAELAAFGLYCDRDAWIVTITAGEQGTPGHSCGGVFDRSVESSRLRGRFRVWESITAPFAGSVKPERALNLGYFDGTLEMMYRQPDAPIVSQTADVSDVAFFRANNVSASLPATHGSATWHGLVGDLTELLRRIGPKTIVAPHPRLERSRDHIFAGIAVRQAIVRAGLTKGTLLEYVVHPEGSGRRSSLHPVGARDGIVSLPPVVPDYAVGAAYTHLLSSEQVVRKLLALDVFRDLRDIETAIEPPLMRDIYERIREIVRIIVVPRNHFVRKACRPNELFFVLPFADLPEDTKSVEGSIQTLLRADPGDAVAG